MCTCSYVCVGVWLWAAYMWCCDDLLGGNDRLTTCGVLCGTIHDAIYCSVYMLLCVMMCGHLLWHMCVNPPTHTIVG